MPLTRHSFFILGLMMASAMADETTTAGGSFPQEYTDGLFGVDSNRDNVTLPSSTEGDVTTDIMSVFNTTSNMNTSSVNSTAIPPTTKQKGDETPNGGKSSQGPKIMPKPTGVSKTTSVKATMAKPQTAGDTTGIAILIVIIIVAVAFGIACYFVRKRERRYSVDFASRQDEANIPLSNIEPELVADTSSQNGLQTFGVTEATTVTAPQEPEAKPDGQEEQKAEADKSAADAGAESAAPAPPPGGPAGESSEQAAEPAAPAPVQAGVEVKTDDEGAASNKTSVESLKEANENNNSSSADYSRKPDLESGLLFWDVPLNCPV